MIVKLIRYHRTECSILHRETQHKALCRMPQGKAMCVARDSGACKRSAVFSMLHCTAAYIRESIAVSLMKCWTVSRSACFGHAMPCHAMFYTCDDVRCLISCSLPTVPPSRGSLARWRARSLAASPSLPPLFFSISSHGA